MKTLFRIICAICVMLWATSCKEFLTEDPKGRLASVYFFSGPADLDASLHALYYNIGNCVRTNLRSCQNLLMGDDLSTHPAMNKVNFREYDQYFVSTANTDVLNHWQRHWQIIKNANFIINNAGRTPGVSEREILDVLTQAHYWRAYAYFYIVRSWGPVPIMLEEKIDYNASLNSIEEIYDLILSDLTIAEDCRITYDREPYAINGRNRAVGQAAVKATMSYVYMSMAGWPLNKGTEYYAKAAAKAKEVIDGVGNGTYKYELLDEYRKIHLWAYNNNHPELLLGYFWNFAASHTNQSPRCDISSEVIQDGWNDTQGEIKFWKKFPNSPRKDASYLPKIILKSGKGELLDWWEDYDPPSRVSIAPCFMKTAESATVGAEFDYKDTRALPSNQEKAYHFIRLAEVYCWYAEALGRSGNVNQDAIDLLNIVRNRADGFGPVKDRSAVPVPSGDHVPVYTNYYPNNMSAAALADSAYTEHGWEIAGYYRGNIAARYWDMYRMYRVKQHFEFRKQNPLIEVAPGVWRREAVELHANDNKEWSDDRMWSPYPIDDVRLNPNLKR